MLQRSGFFPYGMYLGRDERRVDLPGFSVSLLKPVLPAEEVGLHTHSQASFVFVMEGSYQSSADGVQGVCHEPLLIYNPPGTTHRDSFLKPDGLFLTVSIPEQILVPAADGIDLPHAAIKLSSPEIMQVATSLAQTCVRGARDEFCEMEDLCWQMLAMTLDGSEEKRLAQSSLSWIGRARELIQDRASESLELAELSRECGLHPIYFARIFRRTFGCTPAEYRTRCRLQRAMERLRETADSLSKIAIVCGFYDQSHFSKAFLRHFGHSPGLYRNHLLSEFSPGKVSFVQDKAARS